MILPSGVVEQTTYTTGFFEVPAERFARWLVAGFSGGYVGRNLPTMSLIDLVKYVPVTEKSPVFGRYLIIPIEGWSILLTDGPLGTDVGVLPMYAARELGVRAIRAVCSYGYVHPSVILEVYDPGSEQGSFVRRLVQATSDTGRWSFREDGDPFSFEDEKSYSRRRVRDRFTPEMLERYLTGLGVPMLATAEEPIEGAVLVTASEE